MGGMVNMKQKELKISLYSLNGKIIPYWEEELQNKEYVNIFKGDILEADADALVSPANSFGFMDGGLDYQICSRFGWGIQTKVQELIREKHGGELLVGSAEIIDIRRPSIKVKYLISSPTMRVPKDINGSINVYLATRAALREIKEQNEMGRVDISTVAMPAMGAGVGRMHPRLVAAQMRVAIEEILENQSNYPEDVAKAQFFENWLSYIENYERLSESR